MTLLFKELTFPKAARISVRQAESQSVSQSRKSVNQVKVNLYFRAVCTPPVLSVPVGPLGDSILFSSISEGNAVERLQVRKTGF